MNYVITRKSEFVSCMYLTYWNATMVKGNERKFCLLFYSMNLCLRLIFPIVCEP